MIHKKNLLIILLFFISFSMGYSQSKKMQKANDYYEAGEYLTALELYDKLYAKAKTKTDKAEISFKAGVCSQNLFDVNASIKWFRRAVLYKYQDPIANLYLANAFKMKGEYDEAKEYFAEYKDLVPNDPRAENGIISCDLSMEWLELENRYRIINIRYFNTKYNEFAPAYAGDSTELYFTTTRETVTGEEINSNSGNNFADIFYIKKDKKGKWSEPVPAEGEINTEFDQGSCSLTPDGRTMYYTDCVIFEGKEAGCRIMVSHLSGAKWSAPEVVPVTADSSTSVGHPCISPDELTLFYVSDKLEGGVGQKDIWKIERKTKSAQWGAPQILGTEINTKYNELFPHVDVNGNLYFSSDGHIGMGGLDIFKAIPTESGHYSVENMKYPINSSSNDFALIVNGDKKDGYLSSSRKSGAGDDIFYYYMQPLEITLEGVVINEKNHAYIGDAEVTLEGSNGQQLTTTTKGDGTFSFKLDEQTDYLIKTIKENFLNGKSNETTKGITENTLIEIEIYMKPTSTAIEIANIRYDLGDTLLREESKVALNELIEILNDNPITIELMAHTDYRGDDESNRILSRGRANSVMAYLIEQEVNPKRLKAKGYGESKPLKVDGNTAEKYPFLNKGDVLTPDFIDALPTQEQREAAHQLNRRTEFKVLSADWGDNYERFGDGN